MPEFDQSYDARDTRKGGWSWFQQELLYVFTPLVGPDAAWLYTVMCHLIPQKIENPMIDLSVRFICRHSGMAVASVTREMKLLTAVGMIDERKGERGRPSMFNLPSLRELAALGTEELVKRLLGVPGWNTSREYRAWKAEQEKAAAKAQSRATQGDDEGGSGEGGSGAATAPAGSGDTSVPPRNTTSGYELKASAEDEVFQKEGGSVPKTRS